MAQPDALRTRPWTTSAWLVQFRRDVWDCPTIGSVAAALLTLLGVLIATLTSQYAACSVEAPNSACEQGSSVITAAWGYRTVAAMTFLTLAAGVEPFLARTAANFWRVRGRRMFGSLWPSLRSTLLWLAGGLLTVPKALSVLWSTADYLLARPFALAAGAGRSTWVKRYVHFIAILLAATALGLLAREGGPAPAALGLPAVLVGIVAIIALVRRWTWIEADRETFLIERGERETDSFPRADCVGSGAGDDVRRRRLRLRLRGRRAPPARRALLPDRCLARLFRRGAGQDGALRRLVRSLQRR
jgi:hypothetical protein